MIVENRCICFGLILKNQNGLVLRLTILMHAASALCLFLYFIAFLPPIHKLLWKLSIQMFVLRKEDMRALWLSYRANFTLEQTAHLCVSLIY